MTLAMSFVTPMREMAPPSVDRNCSPGWWKRQHGAALTGADDAYLFPFDLPFTFNFYGTDYTQLAMGSNGTLYFENQYLGYFNAPIPGDSGYSVQRFIAHLWDDLVIRPGAVYYQGSGQHVRHRVLPGVHLLQRQPNSATWEVILFETGSILVQYQDVESGRRHQQRRFCNRRHPRRSRDWAAVQLFSASTYQRPGHLLCLSGHVARLQPQGAVARRDARRKVSSPLAGKPLLSPLSMLACQRWISLATTWSGCLYAMQGGAHRRRSTSPCTCCHPPLGAKPGGGAQPWRV